MRTPFSYDASGLANVETALSADRLSSYMAARAADRRRAIELYEWNSAVSAAFYLPLQSVEVALRNSAHRELTNRFGLVWYEHEKFTQLGGAVTRPVAEAKDRLFRLRLPVDPPHLVAELQFGFWTTLLSRRFEHALWPALRKSFPRVQRLTGALPSRRLIAERFDYLRVFRNRIAHHEPIFARALNADYTSLLEVAAWMYPDLAEWTDSVSTCAALLAKNQRKVLSMADHPFLLMATLFSLPFCDPIFIGSQPANERTASPPSKGGPVDEAAAATSRPNIRASAAGV